MGRRLYGRVLTPIALCAAAACEQPPVVWDEPRRSLAPAGATELSSAGMVAVSASGEVDGAGSAPDSLPTLPPDTVGRQCPASLRLARGTSASGAQEMYAAWWSVRPDSSAALLAARSDDAGRSWARTLPVDTLDRGVRGCARPAPSIAADSVSGYVHVVYFMDAPEGAGIFFSHLMDPRALFEPAAVIVYGERPSAASVASRGDTVVVAYETPNGTRPRVELALSYTSGHLFERRNVAASDGNAAAEAPSVALGDRRVAVAWVERPAVGDAPATLVVRTGKLQ